MTPLASRLEHSQRQLAAERRPTLNDTPIKDPLVPLVGARIAIRARARILITETIPRQSNPPSCVIRVIWAARNFFFNPLSLRARATLRKKKSGCELLRETRGSFPFFFCFYQCWFVSAFVRGFGGIAFNASLASLASN